ncbi:PmoA family protein [Streptomyces sp. 4N509B]|uniref:PmoA family protein n=1 Tax=Streptomyces sp. 4N509B TaxID=3457413 RepID=UPI003FD40989
MTAPLTVTHHLGHRVAVTAGATEILSYVYRPDPEPYESRKPYAHPVRTLAGNLVTGYRPNDHRWHKGIQMTASHVSGQNLWGGNSYLGPGVGYQRVPERVGSMRHDDFTAVTADGDRAEIAENLTWLNHTGQEWARERRTVTVHSVEPAEGAWALDWTIHLTNTRGEALHFGSPTTAGREMAGYTGLHWRGPRDFAGGQVLTPAGPTTDEAAMGTPAVEAPWLAYTATRDDVDAETTLVFAHAPENLDGSAIHPSHWFIRANATPTSAFSWAFFEEFELAAGASFSYRYRIVVADGLWDADRVERYLKTHAW